MSILLKDNIDTLAEDRGMDQIKHLLWITIGLFLLVLSGCVVHETDDWQRQRYQQQRSQHHQPVKDYNSKKKQPTKKPTQKPTERPTKSPKPTSPKNPAPPKAKTPVLPPLTKQPINRPETQPTPAPPLVKKPTSPLTQQPVNKEKIKEKATLKQQPAPSQKIR